MNRLTNFARGAAGMGAVVAYQVGSHYAAATPGAHGFGLAMALVPPLAIMLLVAARSPRRLWLLPAWGLAAGMLWMGREPLARHFGWGLYLEHASFNLMMAYVFGRTLVAGREPLCTGFARTVHGKLTPRIARYSGRVTLAWTLFFLVTAGVSTLLFAVAPIMSWSTFANYLSLPLVGVMFVVEYLCRRIVLRGEPRSSLFDAVRAYRQSAPTATDRTH